MPRPREVFEVSATAGTRWSESLSQTRILPRFCYRSAPTVGFMHFRSFDSSARGFWRWCLGMLIPLGLVSGAEPAVPNFSLLDLEGRNHELYRAEGRAVVLFFTGVGCPVARKSAAKLIQLRQQFHDQGVHFWIVNTYSDDSIQDAAREAEELKLTGFPYLRDPRQGVALAFGVQRTAEVVVLETRNWNVAYRGALDDQLSEGAERPEPKTKFLENALNELLAARPVTVQQTLTRGCRITFAQSGPAPSAMTYSALVAPILRQNCVECHREGGIGPWAMDSHGRVRNYSRMIEEVLLTRRMPPYDADPDQGRFSNAHRLSREDTQSLLRWIGAGAPRGDGPDPLSTPLTPIAEWPLGKPDAVIRLPEPQQIPATGVLDYRHIAVPSPRAEEFWLAGIDVRPGNRKVVHHAILYATWPGCPDDGSGNGVHVFGWAPGALPARYPDGVGKRIPAGAKLQLEMHYTTCGSEQSDQTEVALYFRPGPQLRSAETRQVATDDLNISPGAAEARHEATYTFREPATLYSLSPHMHFRGKWMKYELLLPDGGRETLLNVPRYDFKWQLSYRLAEPRHVPAGSRLRVTGAFDNSADNPANPDPTRQVKFGLQSWDEMFIGFFDAADDPKETSGKTPQDAAGTGTGS